MPMQMRRKEVVEFKNGCSRIVCFDDDVVEVEEKGEDVRWS